MSVAKKKAETTVKVELTLDRILRVPVMDSIKEKDAHGQEVTRWFKAEDIMLMPGMNTLTTKQLRALTENEGVRTRYMDKGLIRTRA